MRVRSNFLVLSVVCMLSGCATAYQPDGIAGGYSDRLLNGNTEVVSFRGNRFNSPETLHSYLLRRCADVTLHNGYSYFELVTPIESSANVDGARVDDPFSASATIKMLNGTDSASAAHAYDAAAVIRSTPVDEGETAEGLPPAVSISAGQAVANANVASAARIPVVNPNALTNEPPPFEHF